MPEPSTLIALFRPLLDLFRRGPRDNERDAALARFRSQVDSFRVRLDPQTLRDSESPEPAHVVMLEAVRELRAPFLGIRDYLPAGTARDSADQCWQEFREHVDDEFSHRERNALDWFATEVPAESFLAGKSGEEMTKDARRLEAELRTASIGWLDRLREHARHS